MGRVGRAIATRAQAFGMQIAYNDIRAFDELTYRYESNLVTLAADSDFLVVAAAGGPQSRGIVGEAVLNALGPQGILVNVARGSVVDEPALTAALLERRLGGAGLDVFVDEPNVPEALWAWTRSFSSHTRPAPRSRPGSPWASSCWPISRPISPAGSR